MPASGAARAKPAAATVMFRHGLLASPSAFACMACLALLGVLSLTMLLHTARMNSAEAVAGRLATRARYWKDWRQQQHMQLSHHLREDVIKSEVVPGWLTVSNVRAFCGQFGLDGSQSVLDGLPAAIEQCKRFPRCKYVLHWQPRDSVVGQTRWSEDKFSRAGFTLFCSDVDQVAAPLDGDGWSLSYMKQTTPGCMHNEQSVALAPLEPLVHCSACPSGKHMVFDCTATNKRTCFFCPDGFCPALNGGLTEPLSLSADILQTLRIWGADPFHPDVVATNPSMVQHNGQMLTLIRVTDQHRCGGQKWLPPPKVPFSSDIMICTLHGPGSKLLEAHGCHMINTTAQLNDAYNDWWFRHRLVPREFKPNSFDFAGLEDPRAVSIDGQLYLIGTALMKHEGSKHQMSRMVVAQVDNALRRFERATVLYLGAKGSTCNADSCNGKPEKNWVYLRYRLASRQQDSKDEKEMLFYFITSFGPFTVVVCSLSTGSCVPEIENAARTPCQDTEAIETNLRGGSPAISMQPLGVPAYMMLVHINEKNYHELGTLYQHAFAFVSMPKDGKGHVLLHTSRPFRLPGNATPVTSQNIQFGTGLILSSKPASRRTTKASQDAGVYLSYGLADCTGQFWHSNSVIQLLHQVCSRGAARSHGSMHLPASHSRMPCTS